MRLHSTIHLFEFFAVEVAGLILAHRGREGVAAILFHVVSSFECIYVHA